VHSANYLPHMKIMLGDFNAKVEREKYFKPTMWNMSLHKMVKIMRVQ
jgi:hypothetical protein